VGFNHLASGLMDRDGPPAVRFGDPSFEFMTLSVSFFVTKSNIVPSNALQFLPTPHSRKSGQGPGME